MKATDRKEDYINLKLIIDRVISRWPYFLLSLVLCLGGAVVYLKTTPKHFEVKALLQLKDESLTEKGNAKEKFLNGLELMDGNSALEDEIGILSSQSMIKKALEKVQFDVSYFQYPNSLGQIGKYMRNEVYKGSFQVTLEYNKSQVVETPIQITFPDQNHYRVQVNARDVDAINLTTQSKFTSDRIIIDKIVPLNEDFSHEALAFSLSPDSSFVVDLDVAYLLYINTTELLVNKYSNNLKITPINDESNIVTLSSTGTTPEKEIDFINALTTVYIQNDVQKKNLLGLKTIEFIDLQLSSIHDSLSTAEGNLKTFRASNHIVDISTTSESLAKQLQSLEEARAQLKVQQEYFQYTLNYIKINDNAVDIVVPSSVGITDPFLNNLLIQLSDLNKEKIDKSYSSKENSPVVRVVEEKILNTKKALLQNISNLINSTNISLQENERRIKKLQTTINTLPENERNLINIERKFTLNDNIYNYLLQKRAEAGIALASNLPDKSIVDAAHLVSRNPVSPNSKLTLLLALIAGLAIPVVLLIVREFLNNKIRDKHDLEKITDLKVVGMITSFHKKDNKLAVLNGSLSNKEAFKFLIINIKQLYPLDTHKVIGFSSPQQADGKTFCAMNTAAMFARSGKRTLYLDADLQKRKKNLILDTDGKAPNLVDYLTTDISWNSIIKQTRIKNLFAINSGNLDKRMDTTFYLDEAKLDVLFTNLKTKFDIIIVDTPPITMMTDFFSLTKYFEITLLVVRYNNTDRNLLEEAIPLIQLRSLQNVGVIFNDVQVSKLKEYGFTYYLQKS